MLYFFVLGILKARMQQAPWMYKSALRGGIRTWYGWCPTCITYCMGIHEKTKQQNYIRVQFSSSRRSSPFLIALVTYSTVDLLFVCFDMKVNAWNRSTMILIKETEVAISYPIKLQSKWTQHVYFGRCVRNYSAKYKTERRINPAHIKDCKDTELPQWILAPISLHLQFWGTQIAGFSWSLEKYIKSFTMAEFTLPNRSSIQQIQIRSAC